MTMHSSRIFEMTCFLALAAALVSSSVACDADDTAEGGASGTSGTGGTGGSGGQSGTTNDSGSDSGLAGVEVTTSLGKLRGKADGEVSAFLGIPYAASTEGANRWKAPQPVSAWSTTRDATAFGKICPQITPGSTNYDPNSSEDCLLLNVWTPDLTSSLGARQPSAAPIVSETATGDCRS